MAEKRPTILYIGNFLTKHGYTPNFNVYLVPKLESVGKVIRVSNIKKKLARLWDMVSAPYRFRKEADVVVMDVFSSSAFWFAYSAALTAKRLGIPYITLLHGGNLPQRLKSHPKQCGILFNNAFRNVSPSHYLMHEFKEAGYSNLQYIPNFLELGKYVHRERVELQPQILWVRSFDQTYNAPMAIEVLALIRAKGHNAKLTMVGPDKGDGTFQATEAKVQELGLKEFVSLPGRLSLADWTALAQKHDVFINTTNFDNMPLSVLEAMALGLPIVSTNVGGIPYLLSNEVTGLLVPPKNPEAMADAIHRLLTEKELVASINKNVAEAIREYSWEGQLPKWKALVEDATTTRSRK